MPLRIKNCIHAINIVDSDSIKIFSTAITSVANTLEKIYLGGDLLNEFTSEYNNNKNDNFGLLFQKYTASAIDNIYHPCIVKKWKDNMDKPYYEEKQDLVVYIPFEKR